MDMPITYAISPEGSGTFSYERKPTPINPLGTVYFELVPAYGYSGYSISIRETYTALGREHTATYDRTEEDDSGLFPLSYSEIDAKTTTSLHFDITFNPATFTLTYNANGGTVSQSSKQVTYGIGYGTLATPSRTGYTFAGWHTAATGGTEVTSATVCSGNATIYAHWTANTYTVTFYANGGNTPSPASKSVTCGSAYGTLATCTRTGHAFAGWYTSASGGTQVTSGSTVSITANQNLYAHWTANTYTVTVNPGTGGNGGSCPNFTFSASEQKKSVTLPTRTGHHISGWSVSGSSGGAPSVSGATLTIPGGTYGNITLTPTWSINTYTVKFVDYDGVTVIGTPQTVSYGDDATAPTAPTRTGYTFAGWSGDHTNVTSNRTIMATYAPNAYSVTFDANGGNAPSPASKSVTYGSAYGTLATCTKTGNSFVGWYTAADGGSPVTASTTVATASGHTLYAHWERSWYDVDLQTNGGAINSGDVARYRYGDGATLPTDVTMAGSVFGGWYSESDFSGSRVYDIAPTDTGNKTLYAKWTKEFAVTFEDYDGTVLKTETVQSGGAATPPPDPVREGHDFAGWDGDGYLDVTGDLTVTATYAIKTCTVTFKDFDGTVLGTDTVAWGSPATAPSDPEHDGYAFTGWSRDFSSVTEDIEVFAVFSGEFVYSIRGRRWQRLYTASKATPTYAAESEASLAARTICDIPWKETSGNIVSCLTAHPGTDEADAHNLANREYFDAAEFCAGHENGMHRVHAQATCYRFSLPASAEGKTMNSLEVVVSGDPYLKEGARIAVLTNDTGVIPTDCSTCRNGQDLGGGRHLSAPGVAKRTTSSDGSRWYGKTDVVNFNPSGGLELGKFLFVFVVLENYAYSRGEYVEGSACMQPDVRIGLSETCADWTIGGVNTCYEGLSHEYDVCRDGILAGPTGEISGVQTVQLQRSGDPPAETLRPSVTDAQSCFGLRSAYAALYERRLSDVAKATALVGNARAGAGFVVRGDQISVGGTNVKTWQLTTAALFVPFAVPVAFRADKVRLDWTGWTGTATAGGKFNVWLKRGAYVTDYPSDVLKNPAIYDATQKNVDGYELLGTIDATLSGSARTATLPLGDPLGGYVATILLTAYVSLDGLNPSSDMTMPQGVATAMNVNTAGSTASGMDTGWKPDITLIG